MLESELQKYFSYNFPFNGGGGFELNGNKLCENLKHTARTFKKTNKRNEPNFHKDVTEIL